MSGNEIKIIAVGPPASGKSTTLEAIMTLLQKELPHLQMKVIGPDAHGFVLNTDSKTLVQLSCLARMQH